MSRSSNLLIDTLPEEIIVNGVAYPINTDFRIGIMFDQMLCDPKLTDEERIALALQMYFRESIPNDISSTLPELLTFYRCGASVPPKPRRSRNRELSKPSARILDYDYDAPLIYAAFLGQYGIDLQDIVALHWWKFSAMLKGLNSNEEISKVMSYRAMDLSGIKNKEERRRYASLKAKYALPNDDVIAEKKALAESLFSAGGGKPDESP